MKKFLSLLLTFFIAMSLAPSLVSAQGLKEAMKELTKTAGPAGVEQNKSLSDIVGTVINVALSLVGIIFLLLMVYGGYLWMTDRGNEEQVEKAKGIIRAAIIGIVIVMSAYAITVLVTSRFGGAGGGRQFRRSVRRRRRRIAYVHVENRVIRFFVRVYGKRQQLEKPVHRRYDQSTM